MGETGRRWYRKKRWQAAVAAIVLGLPALLPSAAAHAAYLAGRGDLPEMKVQRLTLQAAWPPTAEGPAGWYQRRLIDSQRAGLMDDVFSRMAERHRARMADPLRDDPDFRATSGETLRRLERRREAWRSRAPLLFRLFPGL